MNGAIILHHYQNSPFAEKIRLILGFKRLVWKSVIIPVIMPKPDLTALTGGYRRTPVLQIGADIYCDSALIADVLEKIKPTPSLYPESIVGLARTLAQWADTTLFWTAIPYAFQPSGAQTMFKHLAPDQIKAFLADRTSLRGNAPRMSVMEATASLSQYLSRLENMLSGGNPFLLGDHACIADFSVYHPIWFVRRNSAVADILNGVPKLLVWADRMAAFGHHMDDKMSGEEALSVARESTPMVTDDVPFICIDGVEQGDRVVILPSDYGLDPVEGDLNLSTENEFALRRTDERAGEVNVHFPRIGFQLKK